MTDNTEPKPTGTPSEMFQDASREVSRWLSSRPDAMLHAREAAAAIKKEARTPSLAELLKRWGVDRTRSFWKGQ